MSHMISYSRRRLAAVTSGAAAVLMLASAGAAAHDADSRYVYVPNRASADVAVIDSASDAVVARLPVGKVPHQVALSKTLGKLVASNTADNSISIIDLETMRTEATLLLDIEPEHMELSSAGGLLAVGNIGAGTVSLISLEAKREVARVEGLFEPHNLTFSPDDKLLYVANLGADHVSVVDVAKAQVIKEIPVAPSPRIATAQAGGSETYQGIINVTRTADGRLGFAAHGESGKLAVIDLTTQRKIKELTLGKLPWRAFASADGRFMLVPNNGDRTVSVISTESLEVVATLPGAAGMTGINSAGTTAFVISRGEDKAVVLDLAALRPAGEIALPGTPETGVVTPDGRKLYVALSGADKVAVIDTAARKVVKLIDGVGTAPWGAAMAGADNYCH